MAELTVRQLRGVIGARLAEAQAQAKKWAEYLSLLDELERTSGADAIVTKAAGDTPPQGSLVSPKRGDDGKDTGGRAIRELMLRVEGEFTVPGIVQAIRPHYPSVGYELMSRRASAIAYRLLKGKKIEGVKAGAGREPNTYRRVRK